MSDRWIYLEGHVTDAGVLRFDWKALAQMIVAKFLGKRFILTVDLYSARRSLAANGFYFGVVVKALCDVTGYTKKEMHEILKAKFATQEMWVVKPTGEYELVVVPLSTSTMSKEEFAQYIDSCVGFAEEMGATLTPYTGDRYERFEE